MEVRVERPQPAGRVVDVRPELLEVVVAIEYHASGQHLEQDAGERVDVRPGVDVGAVRLLWGHVVDRSEGHAGPGQVLVVGSPGDAEVCEVGVVVPRPLGE